MKTLKTVMIMFGILAMVSCKDSGKENVENDQYAADTPDLNMDNMADDMDNDNTIDSEGVVIMEDQYMVYSTEAMNEMYETLDMSQDQINQFEADFNNKMDAMIDDSTISVDKEKMQPEMDKSMKSVLTAEQYKKYDQWKMDHPNS